MQATASRDRLTGLTTATRRSQLGSSVPGTSAAGSIGPNYSSRGLASLRNVPTSGHRSTNPITHATTPVNRSAASKADAITPEPPMRMQHRPTLADSTGASSSGAPLSRAATDTFQSSYNSNPRSRDSTHPALPPRQNSVDYYRQRTDDFISSSSRWDSTGSFGQSDSMTTSSTGASPPTASKPSHATSIRARVQQNRDRTDTDVLTGGVAATGQGLVGFDNLGNTCFMNATLQCLLKLQHFRQDIVRTAESASRPAKLLRAFADLASRQYMSSSRSITPTTFKASIGSFARAFSGYDQHDAQEFLRYLLDGLHEDCNRITTKPAYVELKDIDGEPVRDTAARWWDNHTGRNRSVVMDTFAGQLHTTTTCSICSTQSLAFDPFLDLSVPLRLQNGIGTAAAGTNTTLHDCLALFSETQLRGQDQFRCAKCKKQVNGVQTCRLYRLPQVLVVHLKRFGHASSLRSKVGDKVTFPLDNLDVAPYVSPASDEKGSTRYELVGVVNHRGSCYGGHYTSYCRTGPQSWHEFNDSMVAAASPASVVSASAYVLFYRRV